MQDSSQVYRDQILTNVFLKYPSQDLIAEQLLPTLPVPDLTGVAFKLDESHLTAPIDSNRTANAEANTVDFNLTAVSYGPLAEHSLQTYITDLIMRTYKSPLVPETAATNVVSGKLAIEKEIAVKNQVTTLANYPSANKVTLSGTSQFDNAASDPIAVATTARRAVKIGCGNDANVVVMNPDVRDALRNNAAVKARIQYASKLTTAELDAQIADLLGVSRILVAGGISSDQKDGTLSGTKSFIWGDDMVFAYVSNVPALEELSFGYLLRLNPEHSFNMDSTFVGVDKWYDQKRKSTYVRANDFYLPWTVANTAGYLVKDCLSTF